MKPDYDRAARMAYKTLLALHIEEFPVDPKAILSFCKNTVVKTYDDLMHNLGAYDYMYFKRYYVDGKDALTFRKEYPNGNVCYEVYYDNHGNPFRRRFTLAHELGHIVLKHSQEELWEEKEADYYASQLLAPDLILKMLEENNALLSASIISHAFMLSNAASVAVMSRRNYTADPEIERLFINQFREYAIDQAGTIRLKQSKDGAKNDGIHKKSVEKVEIPWQWSRDSVQTWKMLGGQGGHRVENGW